MGWNIGMHMVEGSVRLKRVVGRKVVHEFEEIVIQSENFRIMASLPDLLEMVDHTTYYFRKLMAQDDKGHRRWLSKGVRFDKTMGL